MVNSCTSGSRKEHEVNGLVLGGRSLRLISTAAKVIGTSQQKVVALGGHCQMSPTEFDAVVDVNRALVVPRIGRQEKAGVMLFKQSPHAW